jgi:hypothetical protein
MLAAIGSSSSGDAGEGRPTLVPDADFRSYYGRPILKPPRGRSPTSRCTCSSGGVAGASAVLAEGAAAAEPACTASRHQAGSGHRSGLGRWRSSTTSAGRRGSSTCCGLIKPTSPLSVGTWILSAVRGVRLRGAASEVTGMHQAGASGPAWVPRSSVLRCPPTPPRCCATPPSRRGHEAHREMPFLFAGSASAAGRRPRDDARAAGRGPGPGPPARVARRGSRAR